METLVLAEPKIELVHLKKTALIVRALNHKLRLQLLKIIHQHQRIRVTEIYKELNVEQSVASQHLSILRTAGFVFTERDGKSVYYTVNYTRVSQMQKFISDVLG